MGGFWGLLRGRLGVKTIAHMSYIHFDQGHSADSAAQLWAQG